VYDELRERISALNVRELLQPCSTHRRIAGQLEDGMDGVIER
jgi:hypothetical protein